MPKIALVTDSTATLPKEYLEKYPIHVVPQVLIWGEQTLQDGIDIQIEEFYDRLAKDPVHPTTSQATPAAFQKIYSQLLEQDYEILSILISAKLSGTVESANQARDLFPGAPIEIVDSETTAMAMGFNLLTVARAAQEGASLAECKALAIRAISHTGVMFAVDTLEFLHKGGRIGGGARFLATALNIKPILEIQEGRVEGVERIRTRRKCLARMVELIVDRVGGRQPVRLATLHAKAADDARFLLKVASAELNPVESVFTEVSPVIGVHTGPGTVGLAYMAGM